MRECLPCTECCLGSLDVVIEDKQVTRGSPCTYCVNGCTRHDNQPEKICSEFKCGWLLDEALPEDMRPDLSGVILLYDKLTWKDCLVDTAVPTEEEIPEATLKFLQDRAVREIRPLLYSKIIGKERDIYPYGPEEFQNYIKLLYNKGYEFT